MDGATYNSTGNTVPGLTIATILFFAWAILTYVVRVWVKAKKSDSWGSDDTAITVAAVGSVTTRSSENPVTDD